MKNLLKNKILILIILFTVGCRKDPHIVEDPPVNDCGCTEEICIDLTPPGPPGAGEVFDDEYLINGVQYFTPCFNPNDANEFVYTRIGATPSPELVKYNLTTKQETVLLTPMSLGRADWGEDGWIVFVYMNSEIWKMRDDGTQLTQVSPQNIGFSPEFGNTGKYFLTGGYIPTEMTDGYRPIFDLGGNLVDSTKYKFDGNIYVGYPSMSLDSSFHSGYFKYADHDLSFENASGFCKKNTDNTLTMLNSNMEGVNIRYIAANPTSLYFTLFNGALQRIDLTTYTTTIFKTGCTSKYYDYISMSPNGNKLLVERVTQKRLDYYTIDVQHDILLFDLNDCGVEEVLIGEI